MLVKDEAAVLLFHNELCSSMVVISVASSTTQKASVHLQGGCHKV